MNATSSLLLIEEGPEYQAAGLVHRYLMPDRPGPYPTIVLLHGRYGNEEVMWIFRRTAPQPWLMVAPRANLSESAGRYSWLHQPADYWPDLEEFDPAVETLNKFTQALPQLYNADPDRMYLMGFSQGAAVAISLALRDPHLVRGIASLVGFAPKMESTAIEGVLNGLPVFMAVGTEDMRVPIEESQRSAELLRRAGTSLTYKTYPTGHKVSGEGMKDLKNWWITQT
ncbi:MAG: dienelactone hydrolase family protein [Chloroflexota bacterium]